MFAPLTNLVGACEHTKVTKANSTKKKPWHWDAMDQQAFGNVKQTITQDVTLAYTGYLQGFEIFTDSFKFQLGALMTQNKRLMEFFSRKLIMMQQKYCVMEHELFAKIELLKEL